MLKKLFTIVLLVPLLCISSMTFVKASSIEEQEDSSDTIEYIDNYKKVTKNNGDFYVYDSKQNLVAESHLTISPQERGYHKGPDGDSYVLVWERTSVLYPTPTAFEGLVAAILTACIPWAGAATAMSLYGAGITYIGDYMKQHNAQMYLHTWCYVNTGMTKQYCEIMSFWDEYENEYYNTMYTSYVLPGTF